MVSENIRIRFCKIEKLQYISHLDLLRTMKTAIIRAEIPVWYSEGFNPHPKIVFALPLSIGIQSICELVDIKLIDKVDYNELKMNLNNNFTKDLNIIDVYSPSTKFSDIKWAEYDILFNDDISESNKLFYEDKLIVKKRTKNGYIETDILPQIKKITFNETTANVILNASSDNYLNPDYIASVISEYYNKPDYMIIRKNMYFQDAETIFQ